MEGHLSVTSVSARVSCVTLVTSFHLLALLVTRLESEVVLTSTGMGVPEQPLSRSLLTMASMGFSSSGERPVRGTAPASMGAALAVPGAWLEKSPRSWGSRPELH